VFDITSFDEDYWDRFRRKCEYFEQNDVIVHLLMIRVNYGNNLSPGQDDWDQVGHFFHPDNNVNEFTEPLRDDYYDYFFSVGDGHTELADAQKLWLRKLVRETADLDNVYYDLVHELHPAWWMYTRKGGWGAGLSAVKGWIDEMGETVYDEWNDIAPEKQCLMGFDTSWMDTEMIDWLQSRPWFNLAIYGRSHRYERAKAWREIYDMPYIGQESIDDSVDKYGYREPNQRVHLRKYFWKFMMAKCQQMDMYVKPRTEGMAPIVGVSDLPGCPHNYDPEGWNDFESDAVVLRELWDSLVDYPNLWFDGAIASGPGDHQYVLSSEREVIAYCSSATSQEGVTYPESTVALDGLETEDGTYTLDIVDPVDGIDAAGDAEVAAGEAAVELPAFTDDIAVHLY
jgi:hypothetical protein